ncbi:MAG: DNA topoisomerase IV subunit B [Alphaproteobacteria bacterium]|nr:DNA topoisomerase IV subunit B [Alphaproteobacteria bacterium]
MSDLFNKSTVQPSNEYSAKDIEILEGLEPVRRRPGMYIGGTDESSFHHLAAEILDNAMDEAVAGYASVIEMEMNADGSLRVKDNGRGIPVDPHPKYPEKSALEVIMTSLHSGGKFSGKAYTVSGGLHGVGMAVVNALSSSMTVEVARDKCIWKQEYSRGVPTTPLEKVGAVANRRGTTVIFKPDTEIFGERLRFKPSILFRMARSIAFLFKGVEVRWKCDPILLTGEDKTPTEETLKYPNGMEDYLKYRLKEEACVTQKPFAGRADLPDNKGHIEWAITWLEDSDASFISSFCNTINTPQGGTHETGLRTALTRSLRGYAEMLGNRKSAEITTEDVIGSAAIMLSLFMKDPQFQGQTKEKLGSPEATRLVDTAIKDPFDHWLSGDTKNATALLTHILERSAERQRKKKQNDTARASATKRLRLPGKLADCSRTSSHGTEIFIVEGDSAGGSAKQARNRETQAILPIRGKILNVASASEEKIFASEEISNITEALGCGRREKYDENALRYEKIIVMTDADVDGAHIASLLMTFFYREMPKLIQKGHLYLAVPPLYRLAYGSKVFYAIDDADKDRIIKKEFKNAQKIEISRFKGLGEMPPSQLKETTMAPEKRLLLRVLIPDPRREEDQNEFQMTADLVEQLMGSKPELRFQYIQEHAKFLEDLDI